MSGSCSCVCHIHVYTGSCVCTCICEVCGNLRSVPSVYLNHVSAQIWLGVLDTPSPGDPSVSFFSVLRLLTHTATLSFLHECLGSELSEYLHLWCKHFFSFFHFSFSFFSIFLIDVLLVCTGYRLSTQGPMKAIALILQIHVLIHIRQVYI